MIWLFCFFQSLGQFRFAGQNLAWRGQSWGFEDVTSLMVNSMLVWFNEYELTDQSTINSCCGYNMWVQFRINPARNWTFIPQSSHDIGHFTQMAYDRATYVGCAFARYSDSYKTGLFACNYASGNIKGYRVYKCGRSASGCLFGSNPSYPALCNVNEPIDPNQVYWESSTNSPIHTSMNLHWHQIAFAFYQSFHELVSFPK